MKLTEEQEKFAKSSNKHLVALASAGSGKTHTVIHFIANKIIFDLVKPNEIISFSFTKKAANELKERVNKFFKKEKYEFPFISTIHSFAWNVLIKKLYKHIGYTKIPNVLTDIPDVFYDYIIKKYTKAFKKNDMTIEQKKKYIRKRITDSLMNVDFDDIFLKEFAKFSVENNVITFDLMIGFAILLLMDDELFEKIKNAIGSDIKYIIVDESQDLNIAQYTFVKLLHEIFPNSYVVMVGDIKQSIYGFRGSEPKIINHFIKNFNPEIHFLSYNFRSAPEIVEFANEVCKMLDLGDEKLNENKFQKVVHEDKEGSIEYIYDFEDFIEILKNIQKPYEETAILARSNLVLHTIAKIFDKLEIPYYLHSEYDLLKRKEVKMFLRLMNLRENFNKVDILELVKLVKGSIPLKIQNNIDRVDSVETFYRMFKDIKFMKELVELILLAEDMEFEELFKKIAKLITMKDKDKDEEKIISYLKRLYNDITNIQREYGYETWDEALEHLYFEYQFLSQKTKGKVQLLTIHKSKGLQWKNVILLMPEFFEECSDEYDNYEECEEEKRVYYVGVTRAEENLYIWKLDSEQKESFNNKSYVKTIEKLLKYCKIKKEDFPK
jgi:DNA helicase-2/ATP-dependent DNA helicase PcrA